MPSLLSQPLCRCSGGKDRAASSAFTDTFNQLQDQQDLNTDRQLEANERLKYNFGLLEQDRPLQNQLSLASTILGLPISNPATSGLQNAFAAPAQVAQNNANFKASQVKPGIGTQLITAGAGSVLGGSGTLSKRLFG